MKQFLVTILTLILTIFLLSSCAKKKNAIFSRNKDKNTAVNLTNSTETNQLNSMSKMLGIMSEPVALKHLTADIRIPGKIASDTELYNAQQEYLSALQNGVTGILESSRLKLKILGYRQDDLERLVNEGKPDKDLIYPEKNKTT